MCTKEKVRMDPSNRNLHKPACVCVWVYMCKYIYVYMWQAHTNTVDLFKINLYADLSGRRLCQN